MSEQNIFIKSKFGGGFAAAGGMQIGGTLNDLSETQDLAEAASKIQELMAQFQGQDVPADVAQDEAAKKLAEQAQQDPTLMGKLVSWGKELSGDASKAATSEAAKVVGGQAAKVVITKALTLLGLTLI
jgi:outer membrane murein-binding lipoprotein Lpp